jgi:hypothetical protein
MVNLYEVGCTFVHPQSLSADEAVDLYRRDVLQTSDFPHLSFEAAFAVRLEIEAKLRGDRRRGRGCLVFWGIGRGRTVRAHEGTA